MDKLTLERCDLGEVELPLRKPLKITKKITPKMIGETTINNALYTVYATNETAKGEQVILLHFTNADGANIGVYLKLSNYQNCATSSKNLYGCGYFNHCGKVRVNAVLNEKGLYVEMWAKV